jgi:hypothetical protein
VSTSTRRRVPKNLTLELGLEAVRAQEELDRSGYRVPGRPLFDVPKIPLGVSSLSDDDLMRLFAELTRWTDHVGGQLVLQEISERYATSAYDLAYAQVYTSRMGKKPKTEGQSNLVRSETLADPDVVELRDTVDATYARRKVLGLMLSNLERDAQLVSRELTRRTSREARDVRVDRNRP